MILLIDNFDSFTHNIALSFNKLGYKVIIKKNNQISFEEAKNINPEYLVIGPGPGTPEKAGISKDFIKKFAGKIPILGICLGHQAIGEVFGGETIQSKNPTHGKTELISHTDKNLFKDIRQKFSAVRYNSLCVKSSNLPSCLEITATNDNLEIMGLCHKKLNVKSVQFHPESIFSEEGEKILKNFLNSR